MREKSKIQLTLGIDLILVCTRATFKKIGIMTNKFYKKYSCCPIFTEHRKISHPMSSQK